MKFYPAIARGAALLVLLAGCQPSNADVVADSSAPAQPNAIDSARPADAAFRVPPARAGHLQHVGMRLKFIDCSSTGEAMSVEDNATDDAVTLLNDVDKTGDGINVMMRLSGNRVEQIRYAATEGVGCDHLPPDGDIEAKGNEPFWSLRVNGDSAVLRTPDVSAGTIYTGGAWNHPDDQQWRYVAHGKAGDSIVVAFAESRCTDSMSGARYPFQATFTLAGKVLKGCALEGKRAFRK